MTFHPTARFEWAAHLTDEGDDVLTLLEQEIDRVPRAVRASARPSPPPRLECKPASAASAGVAQQRRPVLPGWISALVMGRHVGARDERGVLRALRRHADATVITLVGRIDSLGATDLAAALAPSLAPSPGARGALVLDFAGVESIGSAGLGVLMNADRQLREGGGQLLVAALQSVVAEIFAISGCYRLLTVTATLDDALALCSPAALAQYRSACATAP